VGRAVGYRAWYWSTGWLGAPVHEIGHILFCVLFLHRVTDFRLFRPAHKDGTLGYIDHEYNWKNPWAQVGRLFIGIGPLLFGAFVIFLLLWLLQPRAVVSLEEVRTLLLHAGDSLAQVRAGLLEVTWLFVDRVFAADRLLTWQFWLFGYLTLCVASHMELSWSDLKGAFFGLLALTVVLLIVNAVNRLHFDSDPTRWVSWVVHYTSWMNAMLAVACIVALFTLAFTGLAGLAAALIKRYR
jgi:hypothetical protein